ncbi:DUF4873 domain-containing protein [Rhodococcus spelaei]|uniref:DUF4873 domain-containing protein n=1 Tax=Rhodococcus spelaei TaxID=2546320 RepID=UPI0015EEC486|nr:DUF4873 domain-containing protein [Rhodococcus spelaei]
MRWSRRPTSADTWTAADELEPDTLYSGAATLSRGEVALAVTVHLNGHFEPLDGKYHWHGRIVGDGVETLKLPDRHPLLLTLVGGPATPATLAEQDPWGNYRIAGTGTPPYRLEPVEVDVPLR